MWKSIDQRFNFINLLIGKEVIEDIQDSLSMVQLLSNWRRAVLTILSKTDDLHEL